MIVLGALLMTLAASSAQQDCSGGVFFVSAAVVGGSAIYDIATASKSARHYNERHLSLAPLVNPKVGSYGLMASWSFGPSRRAPLPAPARKSPSTATQLSLFSTVIPMGAGALALNSNPDNEAAGLAFLGGLIVGPSVGHFYAGQVVRGIGTTLLRGGGTALGLYSIIPCFDD